MAGKLPYINKTHSDALSLTLSSEWDILIYLILGYEGMCLC